MRNDVEVMQFVLTIGSAMQIRLLGAAALAALSNVDQHFHTIVRVEQHRTIIPRASPSLLLNVLSCTYADELAAASTHDSHPLLPSVRNHQLTGTGAGAGSPPKESSGSDGSGPSPVVRCAYSPPELAPGTDPPAASRLAASCDSGRSAEVMEATAAARAAAAASCDLCACGQPPCPPSDGLN